MGIVSTVVEAISLIDYEEELIFPTIFSSIITWTLYAFLEYCAYHALSLLISSLALITQNAIISANVALFESVKKSNLPLDETTDTPCNDPVTQPNSDHSQTQSVSTIGRNFNRTIQADSYPSAPLRGNWVCSRGKANASYVSSCSCGKNKREIQ